MKPRPGRSRKFFIETHGCQMNVYDSGFIADHLKRHGYGPASSPEEASLIVVNTCSVRERAESKALARIRELASLKRRRHDLMVAVVGCMAQRLGKRLTGRGSRVDLVAGFDAYTELAALVKTAAEGGPIVAISDDPRSLYAAAPRKHESLAAFVTIMQGCDNYCSYCIVPYVRGRERSKTRAVILDEIKRLVDLGVREVTLIGQNVNSYRDGQLGFPGLLELVSEVEGLRRIRFTTSHPKDLTPGLVAAMRDLPKVCEHLHLPLQSGSDRILAAMNRGYAFRDFQRIVEYARYEVGNLAVTTDLMVGFPTEDEEDYEATLQAMERIRFDSAFTFRYSPREGTSAAAMTDDVPAEVKTRRLRGLVALQNRITDEKKQALVGQGVEILLEGRSTREPGFLVGRTRENWLAKLPRKGVRRGETVVAPVAGITRWMVICDPYLRKVGT